MFFYLGIVWAQAHLLPPCLSLSCPANVFVFVFLCILYLCVSNRISFIFGIIWARARLLPPCLFLALQIRLIGGATFYTPPKTPTNLLSCIYNARYISKTRIITHVILRICHMEYNSSHSTRQRSLSSSSSCPSSSPSP